MLETGKTYLEAHRWMTHGLFQIINAVFKTFDRLHVLIEHDVAGDDRK
jgi:hypothetical protein